MRAGGRPLHRFLASSAVRHWGGFVLAGGTAFLVDAGILTCLTALAGFHPLLARIVAIGAAMLVSWQINRTITFPVEARPSFAELARFVSVSSVSSLVNYGIFALLVLALPQMHQLAALVVSSGLAMVASYVGMRFAVFRKTA